MLDHVTIKNFRSLREVSVPLKPLTVLIGENDTGKSTFLEAVECGAVNDDCVAFGNLDHWRGRTRLAIEMVFGSREGTTSIAPQSYVEAELIDGRHRVPGSYSRETADGGAFDLRRGVPRLAVDPFRLTFSGEQVPTTRGVGPVASDGSNVPAVMDQMLRLHRDDFDRMERRCRELVPGFRSFSITVPQNGVVALETRDVDGFDLAADRTSAGVRALILYLTLAYRPDAPDIVLIEEPENGLHPKRLGEVVKLLRILTEPKADGRRTQVILTTHSPYLLDHVSLDTDQVLVFRRGEDGSRTAEPIDADGLKTYLRDFMLGEIWDSVGERGLVKPAEVDAAAREPEPTPAAGRSADVRPAPPVGAAA